MKLKLSVLALAAASLGTSASFGQTTLAVGDIGITGFNSNAPDGFTFVLYKGVDAGTLIKFTDNGFLSTASATAANNGRGGENFVSWTAPAGGLSAGSVVRIVSDSGTSNIITGGGTTTLSLNGISISGDQIFAYQGAGTGDLTSTSDFGTNANPSTFTGTALFGLNFGSTWLASGIATSNISYLPSTLSASNANLELSTGSTRGGQYTGVRTGLSSTLYSQAVSNASNWTTSTTAVNDTLSTTSFTIASTASIHWDANGTTAGDGGAGTWDTTTQSRFKNGDSGMTFMRWVNSAAGNDHMAVFGGTAGTVSLGSGGVTASGLTFDVTGYTIQSNTLTLAGTTPTISVTTAGHTATISSTLAGSTGLTKTGAGTLSLTGTNTYTGPTSVNGGTLLINGSTTSTVTVVNSTGTLGGNGTVGGNITVNSGGTLSAGSSIDSLATLGDLSFTGGNFIHELDKSHVSDNVAADLMAVTGSLSLSGTVTLNLMESGIGSWNLGSPLGDHLTGGADKLTLISYNGTWNGGLFTYNGNLVPDDSAIVLNGQQWWFNYNDIDAGINFTGDLGGATAFVTMTIPEPSAALLGALGSLALLRRRR